MWSVFHVWLHDTLIPTWSTPLTTPLASVMITAAGQHPSGGHNCSSFGVYANQTRQQPVTTAADSNPSSVQAFQPGKNVLIPLRYV